MIVKNFYTNLKSFATESDWNLSSWLVVVMIPWSAAETMDFVPLTLSDVYEDD